MSKVPTEDQANTFMASIMPGNKNIMNDAMEWIEQNMEPDAVWHKAYLVEWVRMNEEDPDEVYGKNDVNEHIKLNRAPHEVFDSHELIASVNDNNNPADVFCDDELGCWAEDHDYVAKSNDPLDFMTMDELREWARTYKRPDEIYSEEELCEWATDHNFTR